MKKYTSVFALFVRSSIYKILAVLAIMTIAECVLFGSQLQAMLSATSTSPLAGIRFEELISRAYIALVFAAAFILICAALCIRGSDFGAQESYTLSRLQISEKAVFVIQSVYSALCFVLLVVWQLTVVFAFAAWYGREVDSLYWNNQSLFLAFCRSNYLAALLPMSNLSRWARNIICIAVLGVSCAKFCWSRRRRSFSIELLLMGGALLAFFALEGYNYFFDFALVLLGFIISAYSIDLVFKNGGRTDEN